MIDNTISLFDLERAYQTAARVVRDFGDAYLPIFKRLHDELQARRGTIDLKDIALLAAGDDQASSSSRILSPKLSPKMIPVTGRL